MNPDAKKYLREYLALEGVGRKLSEARILTYRNPDLFSGEDRDSIERILNSAEDKIRTTIRDHPLTSWYEKHKGNPKLGS